MVFIDCSLSGINLTQSASCLPAIFVLADHPGKISVWRPQVSNPAWRSSAKGEIKNYVKRDGGMCMSC